MTPARRATAKIAIRVTNPRAVPVNHTIGTIRRHATAGSPRPSVRSPATSDPLGHRATIVATRGRNRAAKFAAIPVATELPRGALTIATTSRATALEPKHATNRDATREANRDATTLHGAGPEAYRVTNRNASRDARMARETAREATCNVTTPREVAYAAELDTSRGATTPRETAGERVRETHRDATTPHETGRGEIRGKARRTRNEGLRRDATRVAALLAGATVIAATRVAIPIPEGAAIRG